jgi:AcrR family transcriptional regulator
MSGSPLNPADLLHAESLLALVKGKLSPHADGVEGRPLASSRVCSSRQRQQRRLQRALVELCAEQGYAAVTVRGLCRRAGVSTGTFYELFPGGGSGGKELCFIATYEEIVRNTAARMRAARIAARSWRGGVQAALTELAAAIAERPRHARLVLVEPYSAGPAALERMNRAYACFEQLLVERFNSGGTILPKLVVQGLTAGLGRVACRALLEDRCEELLGAAEGLTEWLVSYYHPASARLSELLGEPRPLVRRPLEPGSDPRLAFLVGAAQLAAREGYAAICVERLVAETGLSREDFDRCFADAEDCFLQAVGLQLAAALLAAKEVAAREHEGPLAVREALAAFCERIATTPGLARVCFVELFSVGSAALKVRERLLSVLGQTIVQPLPPELRPSPIALEASMGAVWRVIEQRVAGGQTRVLPQLAGLLAYLVLAPSLGAERAFALLESRSRQPNPGQAAAPAPA